MRRFEMSAGGASKFWEVDVRGSLVRVRFGRLGTEGQKRDKTLASTAAAAKELDKLVREKTGKGYVECKAAGRPTAPASKARAPAPAGTRRAARGPVIVGSPYHATGPLVLGTAIAQKLAQQTRDAAVLKALRRAKGFFAEVTIAGTTALVFPGRFRSTWHSLGDRAGVLVRSLGRGAGALSVDPWGVPERAWKLAIARTTLDGPPSGARWLFDAVSRSPGKVSAQDARTIQTKLPPGAYVVDRAVHGEGEFAVALFRVRPRDEIPSQPVRHVVKRQPGPPEDLVLRPETIVLAKKLTWVGADVGRPMLACPTALLRDWHGEHGEHDGHARGREPRDFDRANRASGYLIRVGAGQAVVLRDFFNSIAFLSTKDGYAYVLFAIGTIDETHVLEAALSAGAVWSQQRGVFTMTGKDLALLDAANDGKAKPPIVARLASGRYAIERMQEFDGHIIAGGKKHGLMAGALRLRPMG